MKTKGNTAVICLSPYHGGMELDALRIAKLLSDISDVTLVAKQGSPLDIKHHVDAIATGIKFETIHFNNFFSPSIISNARRIVKDNRIKNVIFFGASEMRSLYFAFLGLDINLIIRHGTTKSTPKMDIFHRLIYSKVNWHVAICEHLKSNIKKIIPMGKNTQIKVIYSSLRHIPDSIPVRNPADSKPLQLLYIGRIADGKGLVDAIKACDVLYQNGTEFVFTCVGNIDPNFQVNFTNTLYSVPYSEHIKLPGFSSEIDRFLKSADIFIFPSKGEGLSNSFIEALSYGLTCISYDNTSFPELKKLGFNFFLAKDKNLDDLKIKLQEAITFTRSYGLPIYQNVDLAKILFSPQREKNEFSGILQ